MTRDEIATRLGWTRNDMVDVVEKIVQAAVDAEREACAKFLIDLYESDGGYHPAEEFTKQAVNAIRARGA